MDVWDLSQEQQMRDSSSGSRIAHGALSVINDHIRCWALLIKWELAANPSGNRLFATNEGSHPSKKRE